MNDVIRMATCTCGWCTEMRNKLEFETNEEGHPVVWIAEALGYLSYCVSKFVAENQVEYWREAHPGLRDHGRVYSLPIQTGVKTAL